MSVGSEAGSLQMNGNNQHGMQDIHPEGHAPRHGSAVVFFKVRNFHSEKQIRLNRNGYFLRKARYCNCSSWHF